MKTRITLLTLWLAIVGAVALTGCASLPFGLGRPQPITDPNVAAARTAESSAETYITSFLHLVEANPMASNEQKAIAKHLRETYGPNISNMKGLVELYKRNPQANMQSLNTAIEKVKIDRNMAAAQLEGGAIERQSGAPFAPPMNTPQPIIVPVPTIDFTPISSQLEAIRYRLDRQAAMMKANGMTNPPAALPPAAPGTNSPPTP